MLFKYVDFDRADILRNRAIRLTQPSDFNDPFELHPTFDLLSKADIAALPAAPGGGHFLTPEVLQEIFAAIQPVLRKDSAIHSAHPGATFSINNNDVARTYYDTTYGILSLSEVHDSILMWAHYGSSHRGFVIGFDERHPFFSGDELVPGQPRLAPVEYNDKRPVLSLSTRSTPKVFFRKSREWAYESEWRLIRPLAESREKIDRDSLLPVHLYDIPHGAIAKVFTGAQMRPDECQSLCTYCATTPTLRHVQIHHMQLSRDHYQLETVPALNGSEPNSVKSGVVPSARVFDI